MGLSQVSDSGYSREIIQNENGMKNKVYPKEYPKRADWPFSWFLFPGFPGHANDSEFFAIVCSHFSTVISSHQHI